MIFEIRSLTTEWIKEQMVGEHLGRMQWQLRIK